MQLGWLCTLIHRGSLVDRPQLGADTSYVVIIDQNYFIQALHGSFIDLHRKLVFIVV